MDYKKAVQQAKKELEKEAIEEVKKYIKNTLQAIEDVKAKMAVHQRELKALKADLFDLENGKLDKIKERQEKDKTAKRVSKVDLDDLGEKAPSLKPYIYYQEYEKLVQQPPPWTVSSMTTTAAGIGGTTATGMGGGANAFYVNTAGAAPYNVNDISGTYTVSSGNDIKSFYIQDRK